MPTLIWEGDPGDLAPAERYTAIENWDGDRPPKYGPSLRFITARAEIEGAILDQWDGPPMFGPVALHVLMHFPRRWRTGECTGQPKGRTPGVVAAVLDALERCNVLHHRDQVERTVSEKRHDPARPRIEVDVKHWDDGGVLVVGRDLCPRCASPSNGGQDG